MSEQKKTDNLDAWIAKNVPDAAANLPPPPKGGEQMIFDALARQTHPNRPQPGHPPKRKQVIRPSGPQKSPRGVLRVIPLGGLDEVGKNMMVFEYENDIVIVDMGFQFPDEDMLGIDYVIPDITYLLDKIHKIRGVLITHGHLDHIGAIPYLLPKLGFPPVYSAKLTVGFIKKRLEEFHLERQVKLHIVDPAKGMRLGQFGVEWFRVNHSIPDGLGIILRTPVGAVVHTGDFKFDYTPVFQQPADYSKIASLGSQGVVALFSDSTNALKPGYTMSEKKIGETLDEIIKKAQGRIIIAAFASLIGRIQQLVYSAAKYSRKIYVSGRSMADTLAIAQGLQFIKAPPGLLSPINKMGKIKDEHALILTTGAQGESMSALTRMALGDHPHLTIKRGDTIVLSSSPIPGNERSIYTVINNLIRLGARVIFNQVMDVHTSGHAQREDLKLMINLVRPRCLVPIHGEIYMRQAHAEIGRELGMDEKSTIVIENGDVMEITKEGSRKTNERVSANYIMIDGKGVGDVGAQIIMDRQIMSENGVLVVLFSVNVKTKTLLRDPEVISRGFVYMSESEEIMKEAIIVSRKAYEEACIRYKEWKRGDIKAFVRGNLDRFSHRRIDRHPLILPVIIEA